MTATILASGTGGGGQFFDVSTWDGNGATQTIFTNVDNGNQGGIAFVKQNASGTNQFLFDTVRGAGVFTYTNTTNAELSNANTITAFNNSGFNLGNASLTNDSGETYYALNWLQKAGYMDIVEYEGTGTAQAISHNLGVTPSYIYFDNIDAAQNNVAYHASLNGGSSPEDYYVEINAATAPINSATIFNSTAPTSSNFTVGADNQVNQSGQTHKAFVFAASAGRSAFGTYTGDGTTSRSITGFGFRPKAIQFILSSVSNRRMVIDVDGALRLFTLDATDTPQDGTTQIDSFDSDGFTTDSVNNLFNINSVDYYYAAWG